jgi:hypothetical protein
MRCACCARRELRELVDSVGQAAIANGLALATKLRALASDVFTASIAVDSKRLCERMSDVFFDGRRRRKIPSRAAFPNGLPRPLTPGAV